MRVQRKVTLKEKRKVGGSREEKLREQSRGRKGQGGKGRVDDEEQGRAPPTTHPWQECFWLLGFGFGGAAL